LASLKDTEFEGTENCVPQPYKNYPTLDSSSVVPYDLPLVLVPPEVIEMETLSTDSGEETQVKKEDWPEFFIRVFPNDVSWLPLAFVELL
jgi:nuclear cap-binding protein subunit 1